jgi:hypothetical protein
LFIWSKVREFIERRAYFVICAVLEEGRIRLFPIGSLRLQAGGEARYFEIFARPLVENAEISVFALDLNPLFWIRAILQGVFPHPPALRLTGRVGQRRASSESERQAWFRRMGWLLKTRGGAYLWSNPRYVREIKFLEVEPVHLGKMTNHLENWLIEV